MQVYVGNRGRYIFDTIFVNHRGIILKVRNEYRWRFLLSCSGDYLSFESLFVFVCCLVVLTCIVIWNLAGPVVAPAVFKPPGDLLLP